MEFRRRRQPGQSTVLLALMLVVVVGMTGLSVDVGNAYAQQRLVQSAANAGALAGMNAVLNKQTNAQVWNSVQESLAGNRIDTDSADYTYKADYLLKDGTVRTLGSWNGTTNTFTVGTPPAVNTLARVQVTVTERVDTYFARVVGRNNFTVNEGGEACFGNYGIGVYPVGVPKDLKYIVTQNNKQEEFHKIFQVIDDGDGIVDSGDTLVELDPTNPYWSGTGWGDWNKLQNLVIYLPMDNDANNPGTHLGWLSWTGDNGADKLKGSLVVPGNLQDRFNEFLGRPNAGEHANELELGDWINGDTGEKSTTKDELTELLYKDGLLPMYDLDVKENGKSAFRFVQMGHFRIVGFKFTGSSQGVQGVRPPSNLMQSNDKYIMVQYTKDATGGTANACS